MRLDELLMAARRDLETHSIASRTATFAVVEALDDQSCVSFRAYCRDLVALTALVHRLQAECDA
jgi:hypothetical protein